MKNYYYPCNNNHELLIILKKKKNLYTKHTLHCYVPETASFAAAYLADRNFQLKNMYADILRTIKMTTSATMSSIKLALVMSNSASVVSGERKWQYV